MSKDHIPETHENNEEAEVSGEQLVDSETEITQLKDQLMRAMAETENLRKRAEREKADMSKYAVTGFARDMLGIADNLNRALSALGDEKVENPKLKALIEGIQLTEQTLSQIFERHGIKKIDPQGEPFNHDFHQAMSEVDSDLEKGMVVEVYQPGYAIHDRLLRAAMVAVSK